MKETGLTGKKRSTTMTGTAKARWKVEGCVRPDLREMKETGTGKDQQQPEEKEKKKKVIFMGIK